MKMLHRHDLLQSAKVLLVLLFCVNFAIQKIVDNEANCGVLGAPEGTCPYAFLDHVNGAFTDHSAGEEGEHEDHVCLSCPCNLQLVVSWDLNLYHVHIQLNRIYVSIHFPEFKNLEQVKGYFRPPRSLLA